MNIFSSYRGGHRQKLRELIKMVKADLMGAQNGKRRRRSEWASSSRAGASLRKAGAEHPIEHLAVNNYP
jgi:hypothetical protein